MAFPQAARVMEKGSFVQGTSCMFERQIELGKVQLLHAKRTTG